MTTLPDVLESVADLLKAASDDRPSEPPEPWAVPHEQAFVATGRAASLDLAADLQRLAAALGLDRTLEAQSREVRRLVEQHFLCRVDDHADAVFWAVPRAVRGNWREAGLLGPRTPGVPLGHSVAAMAQAGMISDLLTHDIDPANADYHIRAAQPVGRVAKNLAREVLTQGLLNIAGRRGAALSDAVALARRRALVAPLAQAEGKRHERMTFERLGRDMAKLVGGDDPGREWERAAVTITRYAFNVAAVERLVDRNARFLCFDVHGDACRHCKALYLNPDGTPRVIRPRALWSTLGEEGGGLNIGRKPTLIGRDGGWRVAIVLHPWCRCRVRRAFRHEVAHAEARGWLDVPLDRRVGD